MAKERPNVILFTTDQHRGDCIGLANRFSTGHPCVETPNLDAYVEEGAYFPNAYTEIPSTVAARRSLHGGQGSHANGLIGYGGDEWMEPNTLAQVLADAGYHCINVGWRNMKPSRKLFGFHNVVVHKGPEKDDDYWDWLKERLGPEVHERAHGVDANGWLGRPWHLEEKFHPTNWTVAESLKQIRRRDPTKPFFLWCSLLRPHSPYDPPQFFWDLYKDMDLPDPVIGDWAEEYRMPETVPDRRAWCGDLGPLRNHRGWTGYLGCITHIDYQLGHLEEILRINGLWDNTLLVFTADHGDMMGDHYLHRKSYAYEGSARIPFVLRYPKDAGLPTGVFEQVVGLQDVMPTVLELTGSDIPDSVTGHSVAKAIRGETWREIFHGEHSPCYSLELAMHYLTDGKEKYIWYPFTGKEQLFDLKHDRKEIHDRAPDPDSQQRLNFWRSKLVDLLGKRGDGFSDGKNLVRKKEWYGPVATTG